MMQFTEKEFYQRVKSMVEKDMEAGHVREVLVIPFETLIDMKLISVAGTNGGNENFIVETEHGSIQVVQDMFCPQDKWYLIDHETLARWRRDYYQWPSNKQEPMTPELQGS